MCGRRGSRHTHQTDTCFNSMKSDGVFLFARKKGKRRMVKCRPYGGTWCNRGCGYQNALPKKVNKKGKKKKPDAEMKNRNGIESILFHFFFFIFRQSAGRSNEAHPSRWRLRLPMRHGHHDSLLVRALEGLAKCAAWGAMQRFHR